MNKKETPKGNRKERAKKYDEKLSINTSLDDVLKVSVDKEQKKDD